MPCQRCLESNISRLCIPHLPHHDHIRILPQHRPKPPSKRKPDLPICLPLDDIRKPILDRILQSHDVPRPSINPPQHRIQRRSLPAPCRPTHQQQPLRPPSKPLHRRSHPSRHPQPLQRNLTLRPRQNPQDHLLPELRRKTRQPNIHLLPIQHQPKRPILRQPLLSDIQRCHHLQPTRHRKPEHIRKSRPLPQHPIDPKPNANLIRPRLDMNITRPLPNRPRQNPIHQRNRPRLILRRHHTPLEPKNDNTPQPIPPT